MHAILILTVTINAFFFGGSINNFQTNSIHEYDSYEQCVVAKDISNRKDYQKGSIGKVTYHSA